MTPRAHRPHAPPAPPASGPVAAVAESARAGRAGSRRGAFQADQGAIFVEFLIAFLPVYVFFLCLVQLGLLFSVRLITEHAAINAARAAAVVLGDPRKDYHNEKENEMVRGGDRETAIRNAALLTLTPVILNGTVQTVDVFFPEEDKPDGPPQTGNLKFQPMNHNVVHKVRVRVEVEAACRIAFAAQIACASSSFLDPTRAFNFLLPTRKVRAEAIYPYQGASYEYPP